MNIVGKSLIGAQDGATSSETFRAWNPATGQTLEPAFCSATKLEVDRAAQLAAEAFPVCSALKSGQKAALLKSIAAHVEAITDAIVERANLETSLPKPRLQSETARTCNQLRLFAGLVEEGSWVMARIDRADPLRKPLPKPDVRSMWHALGPVVVFGASNFPLPSRRETLSSSKAILRIQAPANSSAAQSARAFVSNACPKACFRSCSTREPASAPRWFSIRS
jgi:alpha-ketoglutaric semialdehyde dehydrogenase